MDWKDLVPWAAVAANLILTLRVELAISKLRTEIAEGRLKEREYADTRYVRRETIAAR